MIEGIDYAFGAPIPGAAIVAAGKHFAGRYAVSDLSPNGRGISAGEYRDLVAHGIDVYLYWEGQESWMLGGFTAGQNAARNAQHNLVVAGMPDRMPVMFAHDIDPEPRHFPAIDECLRGIAAVIGIERVGIYGGWLLMEHCHDAGNARWFVQTVAWEYGRGVHPAVNLYQYDTSQNFIGGVDVDLVRALTPNYGQASQFVAVPIPEPPPPSPEPFPDFAHGLATGTDQHHDGITYQFVDRLLTVRKGRRAPGYTKPGGTKIVTHTEGWKIRSAFIADIGGKQYVWDREGFVYSRSPFSPKLTLQRLT